MNCGRHSSTILDIQPVRRRLRERMDYDLGVWDTVQSGQPRPRGAGSFRETCDQEEEILRKPSMRKMTFPGKRSTKKRLPLKRQSPRTRPIKPTTFPRKRRRHENQSELIRLARVAVANSRSAAVNIAAITIFVTFAAAALWRRAGRTSSCSDPPWARSIHRARHAAVSAAISRHRRSAILSHHVPCTGVASQV